MAPVTPVDARDIVIQVVKRALHGPTDLATTNWPGSDRPATVVEPDQSFPDWKAIGDALVDGDGQEVLRISPTRLYGIGVLYPQMTELEEEALTTEQTLDDQAVDDSGPADIVPDLEPIAGEAEETVQVPSGGNRPRSIAVSFHVPSLVQSIHVTITGARYRRLPVEVSGSALDLWQRIPIHQEIDLDALTSSSHTLVTEELTLNVGVDSRTLDAAGNLVTVYLANLSDSAGDVPGRCLFQAAVAIAVSDVLPYPTAAHGIAEDDATFDLLYRHHPVLAVGHGTDATAEPTAIGWIVRSETFPVVRIPSTTADIVDSNGTPYAVGMNDLANMNDVAVSDVERVIRDYRSWLEDRQSEAAALTDPRLRTAAETNLRACEAFADDMDEGWSLVKTNPDVQQCLAWTSYVMDDQRAAANAPVRATTVSRAKSGDTATVSGTNPHLVPRSRQAYWRPFQIAFLLASVPSAVDPGHPKHDHVDIIWMPTGGGKTEAYLGLAAFTILWHRARRVATGRPVSPSVDVLMRYTLRLLTAQQVQRASALMCALEMLRQRIPRVLGDKPLRIGAFLGRASTPNSRKDAVGLWNALNAGGRGVRSDKGFLLTRCPWCGAQMGSIDGAMVGYMKVSLSTGDVRINASCPAADCPFTYSGDPAKPGGLPVLEVDEDIYTMPPSFVVGTIDKFAQLSWKGKARSLFGLTVRDGRVQRRAPAPSLFIQDELHLIAGPLGSLDSLYEVTMQELCEFDGGSSPRIIAATATTRNFHRQVLRLYGRRHSRLIPPPALDVDDSFFARLEPARPGKVFVAVCAPGFGSNVQSQLRTIAALLHAGGTLDISEADPDPWWTNLAFFSSRRSLGLQLSATQTGLENATYALSAVSGMRVGRLTDKGTRHARRTITQVKELTATSRDNVTELLAQLDIPKGTPGCIDLCFATSMIEVGVDVPRLGLMTVMGQPKSYSQYIQVTGRVGRTDEAPGIVLVVLSPHNVRDRSHYETFTTSHQRMYAAVEPVSLTPFTPQALERGLAGALTGVLRATTDVSDPTPLLSQAAIEHAVEPWRIRASDVDGSRAANAVVEETVRLIRLARAATETQPFLDWDGYHPKATRPFLLPLGQDTETAESGWRVPLSMRSVDAEAGVNIPRGITPGVARTDTDSADHDEGVEDF